MDPATPPVDRATHHGRRCRVPYMALMGLSPIRALIDGVVAVSTNGKRISIYSDDRQTVLLTLHISLIDGAVAVLDDAPERNAA